MSDHDEKLRILLLRMQATGHDIAAARLRLDAAMFETAAAFRAFGEAMARGMDAEFMEIAVFRFDWPDDTRPADRHYSGRGQGEIRP